jgi:hypothetical protein
MKILLVFDHKFPIQKENLLSFLKKNSQHIEFTLFNKGFSLNEGILTKPAAFEYTRKEIQNASSYDRIFVFTEKPYDDNYFFHEYNSITIFSFYAWNYLTDLPFSNGVLYFIVDYLALKIDPKDFRHKKTTGCIYDFLQNKTGVDAGMRHAGFCSKCLKRISTSLGIENHQSIFEDLKILMNLLSNSSKWNKDILEVKIITPKKLNKREPKSSNGVVNIVIASPGDTESERKILLDSLEVKFRRDNHEAHCGVRIFVSGWEDLASQPGYPQDTINDKIIRTSDFIVAIFKHKLGTPTISIETGNVRSESGTVEELLQGLDLDDNTHPIGMAYFYSKAPVISLDSLDKESIENDWNRLTKFKQSIQTKMIYKPYTDSNEILSLVLKDLEKNIMDYIIK